MSSAGQISAFPSEGRQNPRFPAPGPRCRCLAVIYPLIGQVRSHGDARTDSPDRSPLVPQDSPKVCPYARTLPNRFGGAPTARVRPSGLSDRPASAVRRGRQRPDRSERPNARLAMPREAEPGESRPPVLGSSRAGATLPPEPPGPLRHCRRRSLYAAPSAVVDRRLKIGNRRGPEPQWGPLESVGAQCLTRDVAIPRGQPRRSR